MRIGMLLVHRHFPPDIRVEKEARLLASAGHEVTVVCDRHEGQARSEQLGAFGVRRFSPPGKAGHLAQSAFRSMTWRYPQWERMLMTAAQEHDFEVLHVHDLPAAKSTILAGRKLSVPVVLDLHENYPAAITSYGRERPLTARIIATQQRYSRYEKWAVENSDAVVTVVDEAAERVSRIAGSTPVIAFPNVDEPDRVVPWRPDPDRFVIAYAGGFGPHRGLDTLVRAFALIAPEYPDARLLIMGEGTPTMEAALFGVVEELGIGGRVEFTGWIAEEDMRQRLADSSVGVVPHMRSEHTDTTSPHKLHQYMSAGLPILTTDCRPLARVVQESGAGLVSRSGDAQDMADKLREMADPDVRLAFSQAGLDASRTTHSLDAVSGPLLELYEALDRG